MTRMARITAFRQTSLWKEKDLVIIEGEASGSYIATKKRPALERFRRTFLWVAGCYLLVLDDLRAPEAVDFTWLIQGEKVERRGPPTDRYRLAKKKAFCDFQVVADRPLHAEIATSPADNRGKPLGWQQLRLGARAVRLRLASVFNPWQRGVFTRKLIPLTVELRSQGPDRATVTVKGRGIQDRWEWHAPAGRFQPTRLRGGPVGGRQVKL